MAKLSAGDKMPNFTFATAYEQNKKIQDVLNKENTFFVVHRYIGCTFCRYDVHLLQSRYAEFVQKDAQVFVVMQSTPESVREDLKNIKLPFDIICDTDMVIYKTLEVAPAKDMGELAPSEIMEAVQAKAVKAAADGFTHGKYEGVEEQLPAMFLVDRQGIVKFAHYGKNIMDLPSIDEMLALV